MISADGGPTDEASVCPIRQYFGYELKSYGGIAF